MFTWKNVPGIVKISSEEEKQNSDVITLVVNEDKNDYEGILYASLSMHENEGTLRYYSVTQLFQVKRSDHAEPYEVGYVGFLDHALSGKITVETCYLETLKPCSMQTVLIGNRPANITFWRLRNGNYVNLGVEKHNAWFHDYMLLTTFYLTNITMQDGGRYEYRGTSNTGTEVRKEFEIKVVLPYSLFKERSEVLKDSPDELVVRCVGRGFPDPEIRFYRGENSWNSNRLFTAPGVSIKTSFDDDHVITATLSLRKEEMNPSSISCAVGEQTEEYFGNGFVVYAKD